MYFNIYAPATKSENCESARARHTFNAVCKFCGKEEPRFEDYVAYRDAHDLTFHDHIDFLCDPDAEAIWQNSLRPEWNAIRKALREMGQPLHNQHVAYFAIIDGGLKCGEAKNLVQRYCNINRATPIQKMWYIEVETKEQAKIAEHMLHNIFDHARCMNRQQNKKDYYECDSENAQKFITKNAHRIYEAIMEAIGAEE